MIYDVVLKKDILLYDAMDALSKLGCFVFADMHLYVYTDKNLLKSKKINDFVDTIQELNYDQCNKLYNPMVRQFCLDKLYKEAIEDFEKSPEGQKKIIEVYNFLSNLEQLKSKGAVEVAKKDTEKGSASEIACESND